MGVKLKEHFETLIAEMEKRNAQRFEAQEKEFKSTLVFLQTAVNKAETAHEKRLDSVNEFRATLSDQASKLMPRAEAEVINDGLSKQIGAVKETLDSHIARSTGAGDGWAQIRSILIGLAALVAVLAYFAK